MPLDGHRKIPAVAYLRTSGSGNVGQDKDSERRQREAIETFAARSGHDVLDWFADPGVSGVDPIEARPGFCALLDRIEGNGVRIVLVEDASSPRSWASSRSWPAASGCSRPAATTSR